MADRFITKIDIKKVRHLENFTIPLSETERKHLIITGKNGSGKTSLLETMRDYFLNPLFYNDTKNNPYLGKPDMTPYLEIPNIKEDAFKPIKRIAGNIKVYLNFPNGSDVSVLVNNIVLIYISARRTLDIPAVKSIEKIDTIQTYKLDTDASTIFLQYMLNLDYQRFVASTEDRPDVLAHINLWFDRFLKTLRIIYDCQELVLKRIAEDLNFQIVMPGYEPFGLNEMADGYSALLKIIMELIMRMDVHDVDTYDLPGIAFVDEIETHLHVDLQKKVLRILTELFPNIQFIVTTHSPFVITSLENAVICDLEKRIVTQDLSAYSYDGIIEYYYNTDKYSDKIKSDFETYETLINKRERTEKENQRLAELIVYLNNIPSLGAPELISAFKEIELKRKAGNGKN
jgi:hypothetical protein